LQSVLHGRQESAYRSTHCRRVNLRRSPAESRSQALECDRLRKPHANGNLIASYIQEGSVMFSTPKGRTQWMTLAACGAFYNPRKATCGEYWVDCYGYTDPQVVANPFSGAVSYTTPLHAYLTYGNSSGPAFLLLIRSQDLIG
jgi:hypothetical protein